MKQLLRKRELIEAIQVPKSTAADWIVEFHMFIPTTKEGSATYYKPEALPVLLDIKKFRENSYAKQEIMRELAKRYPMTVEDAEAKEMTDIIFDYTVIPQIMQKLVSTQQVIATHTEQLEQHNDRFNNQDRALEEQAQLLIQMKQQLDEVSLELAATKEDLQKRNKKWWKKLF